MGSLKQSRREIRFRKITLKPHKMKKEKADDKKYLSDKIDERIEALEWNCNFYKEKYISAQAALYELKQLKSK